MKIPVQLCVVLLLITITAASPTCHTPLAVYHIPGTIHLAGLFSAHSGVNCSSPETEGQHQLATAAFIIHTLRNIDYIPGISIGLSVYDTCSSTDIAYKAVINALVQADCLKAISLGCLTVQDIAKTLIPLLEPLNTPVTTLADSWNVALLSQLGVKVLVELEMTEVDWVLASSEQQLSQFVSEASQHRICIRRQNTLASQTLEIPEGNIVVIARWPDLENSLRISPYSNLLLIPLDGEVNFKSDRLPRETYTLVPSLIEVPDLENSTKLAEAIQAPLLVQMAADIFQILNLFKSNLAASCPPSTICDAFTPTQHHITTQNILSTPHLVTYVLNVLQMSADEFYGYTVYHKIPDDSTFYQHFGSFKIIHDEWAFVSEEANKTSASLCRRVPNENVSGLDCSDCANYNEIYQNYFEEERNRQTLVNMVVFRSESWIAAIVSVSAVGVEVSSAFLPTVTAN
ncbi:uncharacterized protein LOC128984922 [Macrosteles quadrilineatus]|uniref:uncharacterized protein LOC128984922 n=1 Tax=Macrosteles quadrilineatus TaxID=74068 RepID=UPI0023E22F91|nr:uncharacterized protein LOC128984922 [Macrosteles quadrilineatus]